MKILIAYYTLFLILLSCDSSQKNDLVEQNDSPNNSSIYNGWDKYNLNGKPKKIVYKYERNFEIIRKNFASYEYGTELNSKGLLKGIILFDTIGFETFYSERFQDSVGLPSIDYKNNNNFIYEYDYNDFEDKKKMEQNFSSVYPVVNPYGIKVNHYFVKRSDTSPSIYDYIIENKKIVKEDLYVNKYSLTASLKDGNNTFEKRIFTYDDRGRIIQEQFLPDEYLKDEGFMYKMQNRMRNDIALPAGEVNLYNYTYDDKDRITQTVLTINDFKVFQEDYAYEGNNKVPFKVKRYTLSTVKRYPTKNMELYYDNWGNLTKRIDISDDNIPVCWRYFEYEYDDQNNWIRLDMFMEGAKEKTKEPTLTVLRDITYFNND